MTNSYNLSQKNLPSLLLIHGLNNKPEAFSPLKKHFEELGYQCQVLTLPGHGKDRSEAKDLKTAFRYFDQELKKNLPVESPYVVIAFSQGALYFQLWLEKNQGPKPLAQVLLAPALFIRRSSLLQKFFSLLPGQFLIPSGSPIRIRRYHALKVREYRTLMEGIKTYQSLKSPSKIPTYVIIDPKDELVDAQVLKKEMELKQNDGLIVEFEERNYLKNNIGHHHIIFHPDFFEKAQWIKFSDKINEFFKKNS